MALTKDRASGTDRAVLIAGPTASGKSALAIELAERLGGVVINADSMQVYRDLSVITARPTAAEEARVPHRLYGYRDAATNCSVGMWLADATAALAEARREGLLPIVVGGTGLYFRALTRGLSAVPPVPAAVREAVRGRLAAEGVAALHDELAVRDPGHAARLSRNDTTRVTRALEVLEATGRSLADWQGTGAPLIEPAGSVAVFLAPARDWLYARIDTRFDAMLRDGALDEVARLAARKLDPLLPAMKAHGVPWLIRHLAGEIGLAEAAEQSRQDTRRYAKRQFTWFRHQLPEFRWVAPDAAVSFLANALP